MTANLGPPSVAITAPATSVTAAGVRVVATATDPDNVALVECRVNGSTGGTWQPMIQVGGTTYALDVLLRSTPAGTPNSIEVRATDANSSPLTSSPVLRTVTSTMPAGATGLFPSSTDFPSASTFPSGANIAPPAIAFSQPAAGATLVDAAQVVIVQATDAEGILPGSVQVRLNGGAWTTMLPTVNANEWSLAVVLKAIAGQTVQNVIDVRATDANASPLTGSATRTVSMKVPSGNLSPPAITFESPGTSLLDVHQTVKVLAVDAADGILANSVTVSVGGGPPIIMSPTGVPNEYAAPVTLLATPGIPTTNVLTVHATDANAAPLTATATLDVSVLTQAATQTTVYTTTPTLRIKAADPDGIRLVQVRSNGGPWQSMVATGTPDEYSAVLSLNGAAGQSVTNLVEVQAQDNYSDPLARLKSVASLVVVVQLRGGSGGGIPGGGSIAELTPQPGPTGLWRAALYDRWTGQPLGRINLLNSPKLTYVLNCAQQFDSFGWSMRLDDPQAALVLELETVVKVWRTVRIPPAPPVPFDVTQPDFCGIVGPITEGSGNVVNFTAYTPLWLLQARYIFAKQVFTQQEQGSILWSVIDYTNKRAGALPGSPSDTGIRKGQNVTPASGPILRDRTYDLDQNIWTILSDMTTVLGGVDLWPRYVHTDNDPALVQLWTVPVRGSYREAARMDYYVGRRNCTDMTRQTTTDPGVLATYARAEGQGDTLTPHAQAIADDAVLARYGLFERIDQYSDVQTDAELQALASDVLARYSQPVRTVQPVLDPQLAPFYKLDFEIGDVVPVNGRRGRLTFAENLRVYQADLALSDNDQEQVTTSVALDADGIVPGVPA